MSVKNNRFLIQQDEDYPTCGGCGKPCYPSEKPLLCLGTKWHPGCIKCTTCGIVLSMRMMETYEKKPYCRAHRPDAKATQVSNDFHKEQAVNRPKAPRRQVGVDVTARQTFYAGPGQNLDTLQKQAHEQRLGMNPTGFVPEKPSVPNRSRAQGVNKLEGTTFNESSITNQRSTAPSYTEGDGSWGGGNSTGTSHTYDQDSSHDAGGYDQSYDQQTEQHDAGGYDQSYDQGHHDQDSSHDTGSYDQSYDQGGHHDDAGYDNQGYDQGGEYQEGQYQEGEYQEGQYQEGEYQEGQYQEGEYYEGQEGGYDNQGQW